MSDQKPRNFWIDERTARFMEEYGPSLRTGSQAGFDVIEKSAYDELEQEFKRFRDTSYRIEVRDKKAWDQLRADLDLAIALINKYKLKAHDRLCESTMLLDGGYCNCPKDEVDKTLAKLQERK